MSVSDNKASWRTYLLLGGTLLSCGLGALALRRFRRLPERSAGRDATSPHVTECNEKSELVRSEVLKDRNAMRARSACSSVTQTFEEVMIEIPVAADVKSKDVDCTFKTKSLAVNVKATPLIDSHLYQAITPDECSWELEGEGANRMLTISLIKGAFNLGNWNQVLVEKTSA